jgi:hypothetical protein
MQIVICNDSLTIQFHSDASALPFSISERSMQVTDSEVTSGETSQGEVFLHFFAVVSHCYAKQLRRRG